MLLEGGLCSWVHRINSCVFAVVVTDVLHPYISILHFAKMSTAISAEEFENITSRQKQLNFESSKHVEIDEKVLEGRVPS